jgi:uncharacterized protein
MNSVVHFEIPAIDLDRAKNFYQKVFGWKIEPYMAEYLMAYTSPVDDKHMPTVPGTINGAIQKKDNSIAATRVTVNVPDIDAAVKMVMDAGGKLKQAKNEIPNMLYFAVVIDTEGNEVGLAEYIRK